MRLIVWERAILLFGGIYVAVGSIVVLRRRPWSRTYLAETTTVCTRPFSFISSCKNRLD